MKEAIYKKIQAIGFYLYKVQRERNYALAGVTQWIECLPLNQRVAGSILTQGTCLCCGPGPQ